MTFETPQTPDNSSILNELFEKYPNLISESRKLAERSLNSNRTLKGIHDADDIFSITMLKLSSSGSEAIQDCLRARDPEALFKQLFRKALGYVVLDELRKISGRNGTKSGIKSDYVAVSIDAPTDDSGEIGLVSTLRNPADNPLDLVERNEREKDLERKLTKLPWFARIVISRYLDLPKIDFIPKNDAERVIGESLDRINVHKQSPFLQYCIHFLREFATDTSGEFDFSKMEHHFKSRLEFLMSIPQERLVELFEKLPDRLRKIFIDYYILGMKTEDMSESFKINASRVRQLVNKIREITFSYLKKTEPSDSI